MQQVQLSKMYRFRYLQVTLNRTVFYILNFWN